MIESKNRAIIFDMDGTLVDSSLVLTNAINYVRERLNLPPLSKEVVIENINTLNSNFAKFFYNLERIEPIHEKWFKEYYINFSKDELKLYSGVEEMLKSLKRDYKLAIATNSYRDSTFKTLESLDILDYFDEVVSFDDVKEPKPSAKMLYEVLNRFNLKSKDAIFIGDSKRDEVASKRANIEFIKVAFNSSLNGSVTKPSNLRLKIEEYFCIIQ